MSEEKVNNNNNKPKPFAQFLSVLPLVGMIGIVSVTLAGLYMDVRSHITDLEKKNIEMIWNNVAQDVELKRISGVIEVLIRDQREIDSGMLKTLTDLREQIVQLRIINGSRTNPSR